MNLRNLVALKRCPYCMAVKWKQGWSSRFIFCGGCYRRWRVWPRPVPAAVALVAILLVGCAQAHTAVPSNSRLDAGPPQALVAPVRPRVSDGGSRRDGGPPRAEAGSQVGPRCAWVRWHPRCDPTEQGPIIGGDPYCPAEHAWVPAMAIVWGVERQVAVERCRTWLLCPGPVECYHCAESGTDFMRWDGSWCGE